MSVQLYNSEEICAKLSISKRTFTRLVPILRQFGLFQNANTGRGPNRYYIRENNLDRYISGLESGHLRPLIKEWRKEQKQKTSVEESTDLPR